MANNIYSIDHIFTGPRETVYETVLDLKKFGDFHPHMKKVNIISQPAPGETEYEIFEEIYFLGFIKNKPYYKATVTEIKKDHHIQYRSDVKKNIKLTIDFFFTEKPLQKFTFCKRKYPGGKQ